MAFDLTLTSPVFNPSGRYGQSLSGGSGIASTVLPSATQFSVEVSVKTGAVSAIRVASGQFLAYWLGVNASGIPTARYGQSANEQTLAGPTVITDNAWHTLRLDLTSVGATFYVDGVVVATSAVPPATAGVNITTHPLGVRTYGGFAGFDWTGEVDEVSVWSAAPTTIGAPYTPGLVSNSASGLVAIYHLDGNGINSQGTASPATALTVSGPSSGSVGVASSAFAVAANGTITGTVVVTPSDSGGGGAFSPSAVTISSGTPTATFTYTPASAGAKTISVTNNGGLANPSALTYTATAGVAVIPVDNASITWSPFNWDTLNVSDFGVTTKSRQTSACGAYFKVRVTGTTQIVLTIDTSMLTGFGSNTPLVSWSIGGGPEQTSQLTIGAATLSLATGLTTSTAYDVQVWFKGSVQTQGSRWGSSGVSPTNVLRITGLTLDSGATVSAHSQVFAKAAVIFADSLGEGVRALGNVAEPGDHGRSFPWFAGPALGCEYGIVGYGAQGWEAAGNGGVPAMPTAFLLQSSGRARSIAGADYVFAMLGFNGATTQSTVQGWIASARAAAGPASWVFVVIPPSAIGSNAISLAVNAYKSANPSDTKVALIDLSDTVPAAQFSGPISTSTPTYGSVDKCHPLERSNALIASTVVAKVQAAMGGGGTTTVQLVAVGFPQ